MPVHELIKHKVLYFNFFCATKICTEFAYTFVTHLNTQFDMVFSSYHLLPLNTKLKNYT